MARRTSILRLLVIASYLLTAARGAAAAPVNDTCVDATIVAPATPLHETVDTGTATTDPGDPLQSCTAGGPSQNAHGIWYALTPPTDGILSVYTLDTAFPADPPTIITVHTGGCGALTEVACDDSDTAVSSYLHTDVLAGTPYLIEITNDAGSPGGIVEVRIYFEPDSPICPHTGGDFAPKSALTIQPGNGRLQLNGRISLRAPLENVAASGLQVLIEDTDAGYAPLVEWSARTLAIPPGAVGTGCGPKDGWTTAANGASYRYRNLSNALPPACTPGSANGLADVRLKKRPQDFTDTVDAKVRTRGTTFAAPVIGLEHLRVSLTLEATIGAGNRDRCAASFFPFFCRPNGGGSKLVCKD